jgi:NitT/TauT family transport system substrate-binding protein
MRDIRPGSFCVSTPGIDHEKPAAAGGSCIARYRIVRRRCAASGERADDAAPRAIDAHAVAPDADRRRRGLWAKQGLTVKSTLFATGREAMQALLGGQADVAEVAPTPLVLAAFADQPVRAFAVVARWSPWRVLVRTDRGIAQPKDLKGKKIGIAVGTSSDLAFSYFLESNGMSKSDVEIVNVSPPT